MYLWLFQHLTVFVTLVDPWNIHVCVCVCVIITNTLRRATPLDFEIAVVWIWTSDWANYVPGSRIYHASYHTTKCKTVTLKCKVLNLMPYLLRKQTLVTQICYIEFAVTRLAIRLTWVPGLSITVWSGTTIRAMWLKYLHSSCRQSLWWMWRCVLRVIKYVHIGLFSLHAAHIFRYVYLYWYFHWKWIIVFHAAYLLIMAYSLASSHASPGLP